MTAGTIVRASQSESIHETMSDTEHLEMNRVIAALMCKITSMSTPLDWHVKTRVTVIAGETACTTAALVRVVGRVDEHTQFAIVFTPTIVNQRINLCIYSCDSLRGHDTAEILNPIELCTTYAPSVPGLINSLTKLVERQ